MTYTSVKKILADNDRVEREKYDYLLESFGIMEELCDILRTQRIKRGSLILICLNLRCSLIFRGGRRRSAGLNGILHI